MNLREYFFGTESKKQFVALERYFSRNSKNLPANLSKEIRFYKEKNSNDKKFHNTTGIILGVSSIYYPLCIIPVILNEYARNKKAKIPEIIIKNLNILKKDLEEKISDNQICKLKTEIIKRKAEEINENVIKNKYDNSAKILDNIIKEECKNNYLLDEEERYKDEEEDSEEDSGDEWKNS